MKHLIVSRVALKYNDPRVPDWDKWAKERSYLYNMMTKPSLINQTNQNFILVSLVCPDLFDVDPYWGEFNIPNEVVLNIPYEFTYPFGGIVNVVKDYVKTLDSDEVIITRLDSDDLIRNDFVENVQRHLTVPNTYVDIQNSYTYNLETGKVFESAKYDFIVSPFVSVRERIRDFKCLAYAYQHHEIDKQIQGQKLSTIKAMQTIHNNNLVNKQSGWDITDTFSFNEWGGFS